MSNKFKTALYLILLMVFFMGLGGLLGGRQGLLLGFMIALASSVFTYFFSDQMLLKIYNATEVEGVDPYGLGDIVTKLSRKAGIARPRVFIIPSNTPNAFATGRGPAYASLAATQGILTLLSKEELEAVIAHELCHVRHHDTLIMATAAAFSSALMMIGDLVRWLTDFGRKTPVSQKPNGVASLVIGALSPLAALLIRIATLGLKEFETDATSVTITQNPRALASALWKIHHYSQALPMSATQSTAHLFIINPLLSGGINGLFNTHPPVQERIKKLIGRTL